MRGTARTVFVALVAAGAAVTAAPAFAAEEPQLVFWKSEVRWGGATSMKAGPCTTYGEVTSPGFTAPVVLDSRGEGWAGVVKAEGTYTATVQCDDQVLSATFKVLPPAPPVWYISPRRWSRTG